MIGGTRAGIGVCQNGTTPQCTACNPGWQGANCDACTQNSVCQAQLGSSAATCNTQFAYTECALALVQALSGSWVDSTCCHASGRVLCASMCP